MLKGLEINLVVPDLWQQEAVRALRDGKDVVVQAPTGSGKTYIFELLYPSLKGQAIFTVPTRALANDKLAEWRARGWDVGIATGDLALNLNAKVLVATLETQRARFLRREGPKLLVVDEYQMIADPVRGVHYELALALAPPETQLLLLSGSVQNPQDVVAWFQRIGRDPVLISHEERPVPLEEIDLRVLSDSAFVQTKSFWPRMIGRALRAELAPVLVFAPRRNASEEMAQAIASAMSLRDPLPLSAEQEALAGKRLAKLLRSRVAYHHSGLSYAVRAGLIEPLAKAGQLNVVVATMGLAAGINFSMRSVLITDTRYKAGNFERHVEQDELLQMFGRAGRRGLDDVGYVLMLPDIPRLGDARPRKLKRATQVDWPNLISVMRGAVAGIGDPGREGTRHPVGITDAGYNLPFGAAVDLSDSLFSVQKVPIGAEHSLSTGPRPCGLWVDAERARFVRRPITEILNSAGEWEPKTGSVQDVSLGQLFVRENEQWTAALSLPRMLDGRGFGNLCKLRDRKIYGREITLATIVGEDAIAPVKWLRTKLSVAAVYDRRNASGSGEAIGHRPPLQHLTMALFDELVPPLLPEITGGRVVEIVTRTNTISARIDFSEILVPALVDSLGVALLDPPERPAIPVVCRQCDQLEHDLTVAITQSPSYAWRQLGLVSPDGTPTRRGVLFSFFQAGEGLAIAAGLEDEKYPIEDLAFDLANIRAGPRFAGEDALLGGRLGILCQQIYARADHPGYLEMGVPVQYGSGASEVIREIVTNPAGRSSHQRIASARRYRARAHGMAKPVAPYRRCAGPRLGAVASVKKGGGAFCREHPFAGGGRISSAAGLAAHSSYRTFMTDSEKPAALGYRMPAEWEPHAATWLSWPRREGISFPGAFDRVMPTLRRMVETLLTSEPVCINVCNGAHEAEAREVLDGLPGERLTFYRIPTNEPWCRDHGPIFLTREKEPRLAIVDWGHNAWGGKYPPYDLDDVVPTRVAELLKLPVYYPRMILEGGSIDVNGAGALLTSEGCLLNPNRNPTLSREQIEDRLRDFLGVTDILWLGEGIEGDDTDGHVDDLARFVSERTIVTVVEENRDDPNYEPLRENLARLREMKWRGDSFEIVPLPMPARIDREDLRLPASYANFYIANESVLLPTFNDPNDSIAEATLAKLFPRRRIVPIDCTELIWGLGAFHCLTQQQPTIA